MTLISCNKKCQIDWTNSFSNNLQLFKRTIRFTDLRLRFLTLLAAVVAGVCSLVTARQFGAGVLEDSFASRLSTYYRTSAQFMALYGLLNFYLYTMAYVYAPALQQVYGQREYLQRNNYYTPCI